MNGMLPRNRIDIGWSDLLYAAVHCFQPGSRERVRERVERSWSEDSVACLSVRSGFDSLLRALAFSPGSEILVSAVTIRDMVRIMEDHGLVPVPIDLEMQTLTVDAASARRALGPRTRAILVAHLFGSRMPLNELAAIARERGLYLIEDCAQAYVGREYRGSPEADACLFSFGPIKTATALGGALLRIRDPRLREVVREIQAVQPVQRRWPFLRRVLQYSLLKLLGRPRMFGAFAAACAVLGRDHDEVISEAVRGFPGRELFRLIRRQPGYPLLALLERRLRRYPATAIRERIAMAERAVALLPPLARPGTLAPHHSHWVVPVQAPDPNGLMRHLWRRGFDATRGASSLAVVAPPPDRPELAPHMAEHAMRELLYLPVFPGVPPAVLGELANAMREFEERRERVTAHV
jgi:perosamine synthetase